MSEAGDLEKINNDDGNFKIKNDEIINEQNDEKITNDKLENIKDDKKTSQNKFNKEYENEERDEQINKAKCELQFEIGKRDEKIQNDLYNKKVDNNEKVEKIDEIKKNNLKNKIDYKNDLQTYHSKNNIVDNETDLMKIFKNTKNEIQKDTVTNKAKEIIENVICDNVFIEKEENKIENNNFKMEENKLKQLFNTIQRDVKLKKEEVLKKEKSYEDLKKEIEILMPKNTLLFDKTEYAKVEDLFPKKTNNFRKNNLLKQAMQEKSRKMQLYDPNNYVPVLSLPWIDMDGKLEKNYQGKSWALDIRINESVKMQNHRDIDCIFRIEGDVDLTKMFPNKNVSNDSPNKWHIRNID